MKTRLLCLLIMLVAICAHATEITDVTITDQWLDWVDLSFESDVPCLGHVTFIAIEYRYESLTEEQMTVTAQEAGDPSTVHALRINGLVEGVRYEMQICDKDDLFGGVTVYHTTLTHEEAELNREMGVILAGLVVDAKTFGQTLEGQIDASVLTEEDKRGAKYVIKRIYAESDKNAEAFVRRLLYVFRMDRTHELLDGFTMTFNQRKAIVEGMYNICNLIVVNNFESQRQEMQVKIDTANLPFVDMPMR